MNDFSTFRPVAAVLITAAVALTAGRILDVVRLYEPPLYRPENASPDDRRGPWWKTRPEPMPTHGDNDRSRWLTVRTLVDQGTYVIGRRTNDAAGGAYKDEGPMTEDGWR